MNTRDLEYLVAIAEELHFGRAAERCHASQPALSGQVRKFEDQLGVTVFERTKRHVRLTDTGRRIIDQAREILRQADVLKQIAEVSRDPFKGHCSIGMPPTIGPYLTPILLPAIQHYLPGLNLNLVEDFTDNLETGLTEGEIDIAILATRPTRPGLSEIVLYDEPFWVALPNDHPMTQSETIDVEEINPGEMLLLADGHCLRDQIYEVCKLRKSGTRSGNTPRTQKTSLSTILALVGAGRGVTLVPAMSLSGSWVTDSGITIRREKSGTAGRTVRLTYRQGYHRITLVEKLADIIAGIVPDTVKPVRR